MNFSPSPLLLIAVGIFLLGAILVGVSRLMRKNDKQGNAELACLLAGSVLALLGALTAFTSW